MKKLLPLLVLAATFPLAAGSFTITTTTPQDNKITRGMTRTNKATCIYYGQSGGCTQGQARKEFCRRAGFGGVTTCTDPNNPATCTTTALVASCDGSNQISVYADAASFLQDYVTTQVRETFTKNSTADDQAAFDAALKAADQASRDSACVALGLAAGCI